MNKTPPITEVKKKDFYVFLKLKQITLSSKEFKGKK